MKNPLVVGAGGVSGFRG